MNKYTPKKPQNKDETPQQMGLFEKKVSKRRRLTKFDYRRVGILRGIRWLGTELPKNDKVKTSWSCGEGHTWQGRYNDIWNGKGCPKCGRISVANKQRRKESDYHNLADARFFQWVDKKLPESINSKSLWRCSEGHEWLGRYNDIKRGVGCPHCSGRAMKIEADYHSVGLSRAISWLGDELPPSVDAKTLWLCKCGYKWEARYHSLRAGRGCPKCGKRSMADKQRHTKASYHLLAKQKGFQWIGEKVPKSNKTNTWWRCSEGHEWEAQYNNIQQGTGCPHCQNMVNSVKISSQQEWLSNLVAGKMNILTEGYFADIVVRIDEQPIIIEYDGYYWHKDRLDEDELKNKVWIEAGWKVLRVKGNALLPDKQDVMDAMLRLLDGSNYQELVLDDWGE